MKRWPRIKFSMHKPLKKANMVFLCLMLNSMWSSSERGCPMEGLRLPLVGWALQGGGGTRMASVGAA